MTFDPARSELSGLRVAIVGGGVFGLSVGLQAAWCGARVRLFDPSSGDANASGIAAGMLAPALETALEGGEADLALLKEGYGAWPGFLGRIGVPAPPELRAGALYIGDRERVQAMAMRLAALDEPVRRLTAAQIQALQPDLAVSPGGSGLLIVEEGRLNPKAILRLMRDRLTALGGEILAQAADKTVVGGGDAVVIASGYDAVRWAPLAPELAALSPIKGHVLHIAGGPRSGPVVRTREGYAAPHAGGLVFGATMEFGRSDPDVDLATASRLHATALRLMPSLAGAPFATRVGVRAASPDGRPIAGRSADGLYLATAARRNGWLLAPLVARAVAEALAGAPNRPDFDPARLAPR